MINKTADNFSAFLYFDQLVVNASLDHSLGREFNQLVRMQVSTDIAIDNDGCDRYITDN